MLQEGVLMIIRNHHEKLDGSGYWQGLNAGQLSLPARILVVADIYDALAAERPYRGALPAETVFAIIEKEAPRTLDSDCVRALKESVSGGALDAITSLRRLECAIQQESQPLVNQAEQCSLKE